eukprot:4217093-Amphidinium_carterae.1
MSGKSKGSLKQMMVKIGCDHGLPGTWLKDGAGKMIEVAPCYELLGLQVSECGRIDREVTVRLAKAFDAYRLHSAVLRSPALARKSRLAFLQQYVLCHITQGVAVHS